MRAHVRLGMVRNHISEKAAQIRARIALVFALLVSATRAGTVGKAHARAERDANALARNAGLRTLAPDSRASSMIESGVDIAVGILVVGLLAAYLLPIALNELNSVDTSSWGNAEAQLFGLLGIFFVLAIVLFVVNKAQEST